MGRTTTSKILGILDDYGGEITRKQFRNEAIIVIGTHRDTETNINRALRAMVDAGLITSDDEMIRRVQ